MDDCRGGRGREGRLSLIIPTCEVRIHTDIRLLNRRKKRFTEQTEEKEEGSFWTFPLALSPPSLLVSGREKELNTANSEI